MGRKRKADSEATKTAKEKPSFSLTPLREQVERARQLVDWMSAAFDQREKFPPAVVLTVVGDYLAQYDSFVGELKDVATEASGSRQEMAERSASLEDAEKELEATIDELKLRHVIGELTKDAFAAKEKEVRADAKTSELPALRDAIGDIDAALAEVGAVQASIAEMRKNHEELSGGGSTVEPTPADDELGDAAYAAGDGTQPNVEWEVGAADSTSSDPASPPTAEEAPAAEVPPAEVGGVAEAASGVESAPQDDGVAKAEEAPSAEESPQVDDASTTEEAPQSDQPKAEDLMATGVISARPDIAVSVLEPAAAPEQAAEPETAEGEGPRLLVVAPDVPEHVYPFAGEVMSMGRGRNNDIQIKNDGKISRYHCRIFRRGDEFIIEDNKSSNGTLVNGKLVTRQRLDGGEQVQIGETRMTFFL